MSAHEHAIEVRAMEARDLPSAGAMGRASLGARWDRDALADELASGRGECLVVVDEDVVVAFVVSTLVVDEHEILAIVTQADARRRGHAARLLRHALARAEARGAMASFLEVRASNDAAIALYRAHGYEELDVRRGYYADGEDALVMTRSLTAAPT